MPIRRRKVSARESKPAVPAADWVKWQEKLLWRHPRTVFPVKLAGYSPRSAFDEASSLTKHKVHR